MHEHKNCRQPPVPLECIPLWNILRGIEGGPCPCRPAYFLECPDAYSGTHRFISHWNVMAPADKKSDQAGYSAGELSRPVLFDDVDYAQIHDGYGDCFFPVSQRVPGPARRLGFPAPTNREGELVGRAALSRRSGLPGYQCINGG